MVGLEYQISSQYILKNTNTTSIWRNDAKSADYISVAIEWFCLFNLSNEKQLFFRSFQRLVVGHFLTTFKESNTYNMVAQFFSSISSQGVRSLPLLLGDSVPVPSWYEFCLKIQYQYQLECSKVDTCPILVCTLQHLAGQIQYQY